MTISVAPSDRERGPGPPGSIDVVSHQESTFRLLPFRPELGHRLFARRGVSIGQIGHRRHDSDVGRIKS